LKGRERSERQWHQNRAYLLLSFTAKLLTGYSFGGCATPSSSSSESSITWTAAAGKGAAEATPFGTTPPAMTAAADDAAAVVICMAGGGGEGSADSYLGGYRASVFRSRKEQEMRELRRDGKHAAALQRKKVKKVKFSSRGDFALLFYFRTIGDAGSFESRTRPSRETPSPAQAATELNDRQCGNASIRGNVGQLRPRGPRIQGFPLLSLISLLVEQAPPAIRARLRPRGLVLGRALYAICFFEGVRQRRSVSARPGEERGPAAGRQGRRHAGVARRRRRRGRGDARGRRDEASDRCGPQFRRDGGREARSEGEGEGGEGERKEGEGDDERRRFSFRSRLWLWFRFFSSLRF